MPVAAHPGLYDPAARTPLLAGSRCDACGRISFPPLTIGCDVCGAEEISLRTVDIETIGRLYSFATVHVHQGDLEPPFTIGEIQLEAGPLIRGTMAPDQPDLKIGQRVHAVWRVTGVDGNGQDVVEPAFMADPA